MYLYLRAFIGVLAVLLMVAGGPARSQQGRRIALVVGNSAYDADGPLSLPFSRNNADDVAKALERLNFEVIRKYNLDWAEFDSSLSDLQQRSSDASVVLFYYSGHAMHFDGRSYLMPINAKLESKRSLAFQMISIEDDIVGRAMGDTARKIVIIDAPPNNPVADQYAMQFDPRHDVRNVRGLAPPPPLEGLLVANAKPSSALATRKAGKSQYVEALTRIIGKPGLEIRALLDAVASDVRKATNNKQIPIYNASPTWTDFYFVPLTPGDQAAREKAAKDQAAREQAAKDQAAREQAAKDQVAREQAAKDQAAREQAAKDQAAKDQAAKDQAAKDQAAKDQAAREQAAKDQAAREQAAKDQAAKDQAAKDQAAKDQAAKDQAAKDQAAKDQAAQDQAAKDQAAKDQAAKDQAARDQAAKDQAAKDQAAKDQAAKKLTRSDKNSGVKEAERKKAEKRQRAKEDAAAKRETASRPARGDRGGDTRRALRDRENQARKAASRSRPERKATPPAYVSAPTEAPPRASESQGCSGCGF